MPAHDFLRNLLGMQNGCQATPSKYSGERENGIKGLDLHGQSKLNMRARALKTPG
jgi:hypothetical protein